MPTLAALFLATSAVSPALSAPVGISDISARDLARLVARCSDHSGFKSRADFDETDGTRRLLTREKYSIIYWGVCDDNTEAGTVEVPEI